MDLGAVNARLCWPRLRSLESLRRPRVSISPNAWEACAVAIYSRKEAALKLTLNKSISAVRLNPKTGVPYSEPEVNVPYGGVLVYKGPDRDFEKFLYMSELYRCKRDVLASALDGGKIPADADGSDEAPAVASGAAAAAPKAAPEPTLKFEKLNAVPYSISRAKVPGGWLVLAGNSSVAFYPDADHSWNGESDE